MSQWFSVRRRASLSLNELHQSGGHCSSLLVSLFGSLAVTDGDIKLMIPEVQISDCWRVPECITVDRLAAGVLFLSAECSHWLCTLCNGLLCNCTLITNTTALESFHSETSTRRPEEEEEEEEEMDQESGVSIREGKWQITLCLQSSCQV